jgi:TonB-dependent SusC/RagA subfamily outer membrane receptor
LGNTTIQGKITNSENGEPVSFANVFLNNSTTGTTTDESGMYTLSGVPLGNVELMVSYVGFLPYKRALRIESEQLLTVNISLVPASQQLGEVQVQAKQDKTWQKLYKKFERNLLGQTSNASYCKILNPWVLDFEETENTLIARASQPLEIENKALGYKLIYYLKQFELKKQGAFYLGETKFEALQPESSTQESRWIRNRKEAYLGSMRHFFRSLINNTWEKEGFAAYKVDREQTDGIQTMHRFLSSETGKTLTKLVPSKVLFPGNMDFERRMVFAGKIEIHYIKANDRHSPYKDAPYQVSRIKIRKSHIELTNQGLAYDPSSYELSGYLVKEGVADMLPYDYNPETSHKDFTQSEHSVASFSFLDSLQAKLVRSQLLRSEQKVYLHLDKPFYASGELIWYSVYLLEAEQNRLFPENQVLYVELISPEGNLLIQHKIKVWDGRAAGDLLLPRALVTGTYRIRAYTNWMRNADPDYFFDKPLEIYRLNHDKSKANETTTQNTEKTTVTLQFFPEGGSLVRGIASRVGFKAIGPDGKGVEVKGYVADEEGSKLVSFNSNTLGIGSFIMKPLKVSTYKAILENNTGITSIPLPAILPQGITMAITQADSGNILVKLVGTESHRQETVFLVGQTRGVIYYTSEEKLNNGIAFLEIPVEKFPSGICQFTLFSDKGVPLCERLLFTHRTESEIAVRLEASGNISEPREKAALAIAVTDAAGNPAASTFSLSVLDAGQVSQDSTQATILTYLLLTSDLKGYIENPAYYFEGSKIGRPEDLDNLMLTQGWRRFLWQPLLNGPEPAPSFELEKSLIVRGRAFTQVKKKLNPLADTKVSFFTLDSLNNLSQEVTTSNLGRFRLNPYDFTDSTRVLYQALDKKGKRSDITLVLDSLTPAPVTSPNYPLLTLQPLATKLAYLNEALIRSRIDSTYSIFDTRQLAEVVVQGKKLKQSTTDFRGVTRLHSEADAVLVIDDKFPATANIYEMLAGRISGVQVTKDPDGQNRYNVKIRNASSFISSTQPLYLLDGLPIEDPDGNALLSFSPLDVARIEVLKGAGASMYGVRGGNGVIAIYTKKGDSKLKPSSSPTEGLKNITIAGFQYPREFYSPAYDVEKDEYIKPDHRATLYWVPLLYTDEKGNAKVSFFNSDKATRMQILIEGISATGMPVIFSTTLGN